MRIILFSCLIMSLFFSPALTSSENDTKSFIFQIGTCIKPNDPYAVYVLSEQIQSDSKLLSGFPSPLNGNPDNDLRITLYVHHLFSPCITCILSDIKMMVISFNAGLPAPDLVHTGLESRRKTRLS
jgi:hypothetical protein